MVILAKDRYERAMNGVRYPFGTAENHQDLTIFNRLHLAQSGGSNVSCHVPEGIPNIFAQVSRSKAPQRTRGLEESGRILG